MKYKTRTLIKSKRSFIELSDLEKRNLYGGKTKNESNDEKEKPAGGNNIIVIWPKA